MGDGEWENCEECDGAKELTCPDCAGEGKVDCDRCYNGYENCSECDGQGEIKTDEFEYNNYFIVTWNNFIKDRCELTEGTTESAFSEYEFDKLRDEYVVLYQVEEHAELRDFIEINEVYCVSQSDNPILDYSGEMHVDSHDYSMKPYLSNPI
jgi:RecJ-like exonuclease